MVADGSVTNYPVFYHLGTEMDNRAASQEQIWRALAEFVPAISSPVGRMAALGVDDYNLNTALYRNNWGRNSNYYEDNWLHSDMKDMAYFFVFLLYDDLINKGGLK
jgi:hypothetical protein